MLSTTLSLLQYLRITAGALHKDSRTDEELLFRYATARDESAFAALVVRHGTLVWSVCRQILDHAHDIEDAFQATFLALSHKVDKIHTGALPGWLHQVARRAALDVRKAAASRQRLRGQLQALIQQQAPPRTERTETYEILHEELAGMSEKLRVPLVLHYLEGRPKLEIAHILGISESAVRKRLERGESILRERLNQRGIAVGAASLAVLLQESGARALIPTSLVRRTVEATMAFRNGTLASAPAALAQQVIQSLSYGTGAVLKGFFVTFACAGCLGVGTLVWRAASQPLPRADKDRPPVKAPREETTTQLSKKETSQPSSKEEKSQMRLDVYGDTLPERGLARVGTLRLRNAGGLMIGYIPSILFTSDGKTLIMAKNGSPIQIWDVSSGKLLRQLGSADDLNGFIPPMVLSPDQKTLAINKGNNRVFLWNLTTGNSQLLNLGNINIASTLSFSTDGKTLVAVCGDQRIRMWEIATLKELPQFVLPADLKSNVRFFIFSPDGKKLASIKDSVKDNDNRNLIVQLWDVATGKELCQLPELAQKNGFGGGFHNNFENISFSPRGDILAIASGTSGFNVQDIQSPAIGHVHLWDTATGKEIRQIGADKAGIASVAFSPDGKLLATGSGGGPIQIWDAATGKELCSCQDYRSRIPALIFSPNGKCLASAAIDRDGAVRIWDVATGKEISPRFGGHTGAVLSVTFSPDGQSLVSGSRDGTVGIWDAGTGRERRAPLYAGDFQAPAALSPDGKTIVAIGSTFKPNGNRISFLLSPSTIHFYDTATGQELRRFDGPTGCAQSVVLSPDGKTMLFTSFGMPGGQASLCTSFWNVATGKELRKNHSNNGFLGTFPVFSPDGNTLAELAQDGQLDLSNAATGKCHSLCKIHGNGGSSLAFSPDGQRLATTGADEVLEKGERKNKHTIRLWRFLPGKPWAVDTDTALTMTGHTSEIWALAFSPDGKTLASAGKDGTLRLWEVATGEERYCFTGHQGEIWCLAFAPDGRRLASGSSDTTILIWDVTGRLDHGQLRPARLTAKQVEQLWTDLASTDTMRAGQAIWTLVSAPERTVPFLKKVTRPVPIDKNLDQRIARLIEELDNDTFKIRKKARDELKKLGVLAEPALLQVIKKPPSVEVKRYVRNLLSLLKEKRRVPPDELCRIRTLEVLEQCRTKEARQLLEELAQGAPSALLTQDAQAILKRMSGKRRGVSGEK